MLRDYRDDLNEALSQRKTRNRSYSLRAFSRDLGLAASPLSRVLKKNQHLSIETARMVAETLYPSETQRQDEFVLLVEWTHARTQAGKRALARRLEEQVRARKVENLSLEDFEFLSNWYCFAIAELAVRPRYQGSPRAIAAALGITVEACTSGLDRLLRHGILEEQSGGEFRKTQSWFFTPNGVPSKAIRKFHKEMIQKALVAVDEQSVEKRFMSGATLSLSKEQLPILREEVENFFTRLKGKLESAAPNEELYQINLQLFDLMDQSV